MSALSAFGLRSYYFFLVFVFNHNTKKDNELSVLTQRNRVQNQTKNPQCLEAMPALQIAFIGYTFFGSQNLTFFLKGEFVLIFFCFFFVVTYIVLSPKKQTTKCKQVKENFGFTFFWLIDFVLTVVVFARIVACVCFFCPVYTITTVVTFKHL